MKACCPHQKMVCVTNKKMEQNTKNPKSPTNKNLFCLFGFVARVCVCVCFMKFHEQTDATVVFWRFDTKLGASWAEGLSHPPFAWNLRGRRRGGRWGLQHRTGKNPVVHLKQAPARSGAVFFAFVFILRTCLSFFASNHSVFHRESMQFFPRGSVQEQKLNLCCGQDLSETCLFCQKMLVHLRVRKWPNTQTPDGSNSCNNTEKNLENTPKTRDTA